MESITINYIGTTITKDKNNIYSFEMVKHGKQEAKTFENIKSLIRGAKACKIKTI